MTRSPEPVAEDPVDSPVAGSTWRRLFPVGVIVGFGVGLWYSGVASQLTDPEQLRGWIESAGPLAPLAFIVMLVPLNVFFLAGAPIWVSASLFPTPLAITYSVIGAVAASSGSYALARYLGADWARSRIPRQLNRFTDGLEQRPLRSVATLRVLLWLNPGVDLLTAVSGVTTRDFVIGTALGIALPTALRVYVGRIGMEALMDSNPWFWVALAVVVAAIVGQRVWARRASAADAAES